jgi:NAD(P)-dependent dehydrogenase (short-subunit alcohol dehydrogenase family)
MGRGLLQDRIALVTGAGSGIGREVARTYADEGASVVLLDRNGEGASQVADEISAAGGTADAFSLDITDYDRYNQAVNDSVEKYGRIDVLVNNAAISIPGTILEGTLDQWRTTLQVNLEAVYVGSKLVLPSMVALRRGRIITISSIQAFVTDGGVGAYTASKGGIVALTKSMAVELAPYNIAVNAIAPGFIRTRMSVVGGIDETTTEEFQDLYIRRRKIPMARAGIPDDIAGTAVFLASDYCRYMTGQVLVVDGGLTSTF